MDLPSFAKRSEMIRERSLFMRGGGGGGDGRKFGNFHFFSVPPQNI